MIPSKQISFLLFLIISVLISACNSKQETQKSDAEIDQSPPSVTASQESVLLVQLSKKEQQELKIETFVVKSEIQNYTLVVPGVVFPAPGYVSIISTPLDGRISAVLAKDGQVIQKGQELFKIESLAFGNLLAEYLQALAEERFQTTRLERLKQLVEKTISSRSELERAQSDFQRATAASVAAVSKLKAIGVPDHEIEMLKNAEQIDPSLKIHSPISGSFDQRDVELGQSVDALQKLGRIIDINRVLIKGYLSPEDARFVASGDEVLVTRRQEQGVSISGKVSSVNPGLDETSRSVVVNIEVETQNSWPKPGENVRLEISTNTSGEVYAIPIKALTYDGNIPVVFIKKDISTYEKRKLVVSEIRDQMAIVESGLKVGEELAISQVFSLKALSRYEMIAEE
ncbi:efflux RND transporter periplasmic adaptor subunit [Sunxiuqinia sp. A32]|uniref:efflux RND transporter periplasmic adaptor subunit n=1 Tax=Sunxiuqinia sp. A32 TaxID=3461496 RepID=UPI004045C3FB